MIVSHIDILLQFFLAQEKVQMCPGNSSKTVFTDFPATNYLIGQKSSDLQIIMSGEFIPTLTLSCRKDL